MPADYRGLLQAAWQEHQASRSAGAPSAVSLFAGAGGSALGLSMAGFDLRLAVECEPHALACLALNFPHTALSDRNLREMEADSILNRAGIGRGELDLLEASPPCQGFSKAGKRRSDDPRNELLQEVLRFTAGCRPKALALENVDSLLMAQGRARFAPFFAGLEAQGYRVGAWILNAAHFNVPQHRRRALVLALRRDIRPAGQLLPPRPESWPRPLGAAISDLGPEPCSEKGHVWVDESPNGRNTRTWQLAARAPQGGRYAGHQRRLCWDAPAFTLTASNDGRRDKRPYLRNMHCHPLWTRTLSPAECKRVASFPDAFCLEGEAHPEHWHRGISRLGNAVPPLFMRAVARHLRQLLTGEWFHV